MKLYTAKEWNNIMDAFEKRTKEIRMEFDRTDAVYEERKQELQRQKEMLNIERSNDGFDLMCKELGI